MKKRKHSFIPGLDFDRLEARAMLDGSGDDLPDPEIQDLYDQAEQAILHTVPPASFDVVAMGDFDKQEIIDVIEEQRTAFNDEIDAAIKEEQDFQVTMNGYKSQILAVTSQWPADWWKPENLTPNGRIILKGLNDINAAITESQAVVSSLQSHKTQYNDTIDDLESRIWSTMADSGQQDENDNPIMVAYYQSDALYLTT